MNNFAFSTAGQIVFGAGKLSEINKLLPGNLRRVLLVSGQGGANPERLREILEAAGRAVTPLVVTGEPVVSVVQQGLHAAREAGCEGVIGFGGGSVIDTGKAVAVLLSNPGELLDYLEVVGKNQPLANPSAFYVAVPTTAGTGSEVTRNAVLAVPEARMKVSLRSPYMLPAAALVDPELTLSLPPSVTAYTGMDALTQVIEPYVSRRANPLTDLFCREGIQRAARALPVVYREGGNLAARTEMCYASLLGGLALANAGLGAAHGFASPIGGMYDTPHGAICACLLPVVVAANVQALRSRAPDSPVLERYREIARWLTGSERATIQDGIRWLGDLARELDIPPLSAFGIRPQDLRVIADKASTASSMKANPIDLEPEELVLILEQAL